MEDTALREKRRPGLCELPWGPDLSPCSPGWARLFRDSRTSIISRWRHCFGSAESYFGDSISSASSVNELWPECRRLRKPTRVPMADTPACHDPRMETRPLPECRIPESRRSQRARHTSARRIRASFRRRRGQAQFISCLVLCLYRNLPVSHPENSKALAAEGLIRLFAP